MGRLGPSLWDDPNYVLGTIEPRGRGFDIGSPQNPFRNGYFTGGVQFGGGGANAPTITRLVTKLLGIPDNTATAIATIVIPNASLSASIQVFLTSANGGTDAFESTRNGRGAIAVTRVLDGTAAVAALAITNAVIATVSGGATHTLSYAVDAVAGAASGEQTCSITVTIDDSGNVGDNMCVLETVVTNMDASNPVTVIEV